MRKARVLVTQKCNKSCDGCCNKSNILDSMVTITSIDDLTCYDEIMITGGEPVLVGSKVVALFKQLARNFYLGNRLFYSASYDKGFYENILPLVDGFQYTLHYEAKDSDVKALKDLSNHLKRYLSKYPSENYKSFRLAIDKRLYDLYDFSNIDFSAWTVIRKMEWKKDCPLPDKEELLYFDVEKFVWRG